MCKFIIVSAVSLIVGFVIGWASDTGPRPASAVISDPSARDSLIFRLGQSFERSRYYIDRLAIEDSIRKNLLDPSRTKNQEDDYKAHFDTAGFRALVDSLFAE
jgi:hypothetical protein